MIVSEVVVNRDVGESDNVDDDSLMKVPWVKSSLISCICIAVISQHGSASLNYLLYVTAKVLDDVLPVKHSP